MKTAPFMIQGQMVKFCLLAMRKDMMVLNHLETAVLQMRF
ncbi:MAG: hypothetical protein Ct9H300mP28_25050 [Pseudomonadota bacterium]|nr:MAG: hypothetical protein Ct9H300mP28_25050 [Pseudomonadota bacterium]